MLHELRRVHGQPKPEYAAVNRLLIATLLPPGKQASIADVIRLCGWQKGGTQYDDVREAVPLDEWIRVQLVSGEVRELRRFRVGRRREMIECRLATPPPRETVKEPIREDEPEVSRAKQRRQRQDGGKVSAFNLIKRGLLQADEFERLLDEPLSGENVKAEFEAAIADLQRQGRRVLRAGNPHCRLAPATRLDRRDDGPNGPSVPRHRHGALRDAGRRPATS